MKTPQLFNLALIYSLLNSSSIQAQEPYPKPPELFPEDKDGFCPPGTFQKGDVPPKAFAIWCEKPDTTKHGPYRSYYLNGGKLKESFSYFNGQYQGYYTTYHHTGKKATEAHYVAGVLDGDYYAEDQTGNDRTWKTYKNGMLHGKATYITIDGTTKTENYILGKLVGIVEYRAGTGKGFLYKKCQAVRGKETNCVSFRPKPYCSGIGTLLTRQHVSQLIEFGYYYRNLPLDAPAYLASPFAEAVSFTSTPILPVSAPEIKVVVNALVRVRSPSDTTLTWKQASRTFVFVYKDEIWKLRTCPWK